MCSIIEAWGDNDFSQLTGRVTEPSSMMAGRVTEPSSMMAGRAAVPAANEASMMGVRSNQQAMDIQRSERQSTDTNSIQAIRAMSMYPAPDQVGQPVTWADNRRQYAQPNNELMNSNGGEPANQNNLGGGWQTAYCKPRQDMNSMTRGVHSRYSREKRVDAQTAELPYGGQITTDVDPAMITGDANGRPGYLDLYSKGYEGRKWMPNMTTTTTQQARAGNGRPEAGVNPPPTTTTEFTQRPGTTKYNPTTSSTSPSAANDVPEKFMQIYEDTFDDMSANTAGAAIKSPFTEEIITNPRLIAENLAARAEQLRLASTGSKSQSSTGKSVGPVPDDIRAIQVQLNSLVAKMNNLEQKVSYVENNKSHDIILFIVIAIFILFVLDNVFKLGKFS